MRNKIIILGGLGLLGKNLIKTCKERKIPFVSVGKKGCDLNLDLTNISLVSDMLKNISDETIINATGYTSLNQCEKNYDECFKINTRIVENFIENPLRKNFKFVQISTDQLYKGEKNVLNKEESKKKEAAAWDRDIALKKEEFDRKQEEVKELDRYMKEQQDKCLDFERSIVGWSKAMRENREKLTKK